MPLLDHFHPPLSERRPWESFHATWCSTLADHLNRDTLPPGYLALEYVSSERFSIEVHSTEGGRTLVAALELVSPGNKDRAEKRRLFAAKCATYLARGLGLIVIDIVTSRHGNLHNELLDLVDLDAAFRMLSATFLYTVAYRPLRRPEGDQVETWPMPLALGEVLPCVPLSLAADCCVAVDLEAAYRDACGRRRVEEALR